MNAESMIPAQVALDSRSECNSAAGISERTSKILHPIFSKRRTSEFDLPATDDEDDIVDTKSAYNPSGRRQGRLEVKSCPADYSTATEGTKSLFREENRMDKTKRKDKFQIPVQERPWSNSAKRRASESDLPATDDEDEIFDTKPVYFPSGRRRGRLEVKSCSADYLIRRNSTPTEETKSLFREKNRLDKTKRKGMIQIPVQERPWSNSAKKLGGRTSEDQHLNLSKTRSIASDLPSSDEDEVIEPNPIQFPSGRRRGRLAVNSCSADYFTPRSNSPVLSEYAMSSSSEKKKMDKSGKRNDIQGGTSKNLHTKLGRWRSLSESDVFQDQKEDVTLDYHNGRGRSYRTSWDSNADYFLHRSHGKLTENAKKLSQEEIHSLELDIFKPLDFYEILFERMKITGNKAASGSQ